MQQKKHQTWPLASISVPGEYHLKYSEGVGNQTHFSKLGIIADGIWIDSDVLIEAVGPLIERHGGSVVMELYRYQSLDSDWSAVLGTHPLFKKFKKSKPRGLVYKPLAKHLNGIERMVKEAAAESALRLGFVDLDALRKTLLNHVEKVHRYGLRQITNGNTNHMVMERDYCLVRAMIVLARLDTWLGTGASVPKGEIYDTSPKGQMVDEGVWAGDGADHAFTLFDEAQNKVKPITTLSSPVEMNPRNASLIAKWGVEVLGSKVVDLMNRVSDNTPQLNTLWSRDCPHQVGGRMLATIDDSSSTDIGPKEKAERKATAAKAKAAGYHSECAYLESRS